MNNILEIIKPYIEGLFEAGAIFELVAVNKIRVTGPNPNSKLGFKFRRPIILVLEDDVIHAYIEAKDICDQQRLLAYAHSIKRVINSRLIAYDADGEKGTAFEIYLDSRAVDF